MNLISHLHDKIDTAGLWEDYPELSRNEHLKVRGSTDTRLYYVVSGTLRVYVIDEFEEHTIRFGYQGSIIAALDSFITGKPSDFYIQALKKTELKMIPKTTYMEFVQSNAENLQLWHDILEQMVYQQMERERDLLTSSPLERYERVLKRSPQLFQEVPHKYIASYLRMTPETLSRIKKS
ncbi:Crp/Fnr family transcriptional regulator [Fulvivirga sp. 29W222]|uniref:Crp/Fnr family transcriptional regulator n=1 Tax=Fulvivirga marina TaxID=2494733 RepID=A0A937G3I8_9BACT|nr:Crp/Fnr family transcriptional regulator [Fulvivirga marina]MBL6447776.1 Crp/Fnr family transcriptional regulator [Fulvivirga marina]